MMKKLFLILLMGCICICADAQERKPGEDFGGLAFKVAQPTGVFSEGYNLGWGIAAMNEYVLTNKWSVSFDVSYLRWSAKKVNEPVEAVSTIAFTASPKYYFGNVYLSLEVGGFYKTIIASRGIRFTESYQFGVIPAIGFHRGAFDFSIEYAFVENQQWVNLRTGFYLFDFQLN